MTNRAAFSPSEWALVTDALTQIGRGATLLHAGLVSGLRERRAASEVLASFQRGHADLELIQALTAPSRDEGEESEPPPSAVDGDLLDLVLDEVLGGVRLVDAKATPAEATAHRQLLREVAIATTGAAGEGVFGTGEKLSDDERTFLAELDATLEGKSWADRRR